MLNIKVKERRENWYEVFSGNPIKDKETPKDYFQRIGKIIKEQPSSVKGAYYRLAKQQDKRQNWTIPDFKGFSEKQAAPETFSEKYVMPDGIDESKPPFILEGCKKLWVGGDFHFPFHDRQAIMTALTQAEGCDVILLNGDVMDCYSESKFAKNPMHRLLKEEADLVRDFLEYLRGRFKKSRILFKFGNHEKRHQDYINRNADVLTGLDETLLPALLRFNIHGIEEIHHTQLIRCGKLNIIHGHEYGGGGGINVGRNYLLKAFDNILFNHWHKEASYPQPKINGEIVGAWAVGCLCKLHPEYRPMNNGWVHGFATVEFDGDFFYVQNKKIMNGKIL